MSNLVFTPAALETVLSLPGLPGGGSRIYDRSRYGSYGAITGAAWERLPSGLWCLSFDGSDDYVSLESRSSLNPVDGLTVEAWVYLASHKNYNYILHKEIWVANGWGLIGDSAGAVNFQLRHNANGNWEIATINPSAGTWHHIVGTVDYLADIASLYLDGILGDSDNTPTGTIEPENNTGTLYLGASSNSFDGKITLVRIYNRPLTALDVQNNFNREKHLFGVW